MYPFTNQVGTMKVSQAMPIMNFIAVDWNQRLRCTPDHKMLSFGKSFRIVNRILVQSARNN